MKRQLKSAEINLTSPKRQNASGANMAIYGDQDEIVFTYASRRATEHLKPN